MIRRMLACALLLACAHGGANVYSPPAKLVVVSDDNYPPYLFRDADGTLQGILKDKWELWSRRTGVPVQIRGTRWALAQELSLIHISEPTRPY